jgi:hypothetical protein
MPNKRSFVLKVDSTETMFMETLSYSPTLLEVNLDLGASDVMMSYRGNGIFVRSGRNFSLSGTLQDFDSQTVILAVKFTIRSATAEFYPAGLSPAIVLPHEDGKIFTWPRA